MTITYTDHIAGRTVKEVEGSVQIWASALYETHGLAYGVSGLEVEPGVSQRIGMLVFTDESWDTCSGQFSLGPIQVQTEVTDPLVYDFRSYYSRTYGD